MLIILWYNIGRKGGNRHEEKSRTKQRRANHTANPDCEANQKKRRIRKKKA
jgi:hypothetical protein